MLELQLQECWRSVPWQTIGKGFFLLAWLLLHIGIQMSSRQTGMYVFLMDPVQPLLLVPLSGFRSSVHSLDIVCTLDSRRIEIASFNHMR